MRPATRPPADRSRGAARARPLAVALVACALSAPWPARAQPPDATRETAAPRASAAATPARVEVVLGGDAADTNTLVPVLDELLARLPVAAHFVRAARVDPRDVLAVTAAAEHTLARVWIALDDPARASVYLTDRSAQRVLVRRVPLRAGVDEVAREALGHIVADAILALLDGLEIGFTRERARAELAPGARPPTPPRDSRGARLMLGLGYEAQWYGDDALAHGPLGVLGASLRAGALRVGLELQGQYRFALTRDGVAAGVALTQGALRAQVFLETSPLGVFSLRATLGGGLDVVDVAPRALAPGVVLDPRRALVLPVVRATVGATLALGPELALVLWLGADLDPSGVHYFVQRGDTRDELLAPFALRPGVGLTLLAEVR